MQSVRYFLRAIGDVTNLDAASQGVVTAQAAEDEIASKYLSQGYEIESTHFTGTIKDQKGNDVGYRILHVLVKPDQPIAVREPVKKDK